MIGDEAKTAPLVPARAMQGANDVNRPVGRSARSLDLIRALGVRAGNGVKAGNGLRLTHLPGSNRASRSNTPGGKQGTPDVDKPPTGEPYAGKPPVRFGGRGGRKSFPTPIQAARRQHVAQVIHLLLGVAIVPMRAASRERTGCQNPFEERQARRGG